MKTKEFMDKVHLMLGTNKDEYEIFYHTPESKFLYNFRARHAGDYENHQRLGCIDRFRIWRMLRHSTKTEIVMEMTDISTVVSRSMLIEIANTIIDEVNDALTCRYGKDAILHERIIDPRLISKVISNGDDK